MYRLSRWPAAVAAALGAAVLAWLPSHAQAPAGGTTALTGARVIDGTGAPPLERATIVITNGRISAVGADGAVSIPAGATRVDLSGRTIVPGFINAHGHLDNGDESLPLYDRLVEQLALYAHFGVTTVVTLGDDGTESVRVSRDNDRMPIERARLHPSGPAVVAATVEEARQSIDRAADMGVEVIKTRMEGRADDMTPEVYTALIQQAHARQLRVAAHIYNLEDARGLVNAGLDVVGHSVRDRDVDDAFVDALERRDVGYIPTLTRELSVFVYETTPAFFTDPFFLRGGPAYTENIGRFMDPALQEKTRLSQQTRTIKLALAQANRNLKRLADGGVPIAMGTDSGASVGRWQGFFEHVEMEMMVEAGLTPMQVLVAATSGAARVMRLDDVGAIQPGRRADLLVLTANPLTDIRNTRQIDAVWVGGRRLANPRSN